MKLYHGYHNEYVEAPVTPKMLRQMKAWAKQGICHVQIKGVAPGSKTYILLYIEQVLISRSIAMSGK